MVAKMVLAAAKKATSTVRSTAQRVSGRSGAAETAPGPTTKAASGRSSTAAAKKATAAKTTAAKSGTTKTGTKKATTRTSPTKTTATKASTTKTTGTKATTTKATTTKATATKATTTKATTTKATTGRGTTAARPAVAATATRAAASTTQATAKKPTTTATAKAAAKKTPTTPATNRVTAGRTARKAGTSVSRASQPRSAALPSSLPVLEGESPWTAAEVEALRAEIRADIVRLEQDLQTAESELVDLMRDSGDGAGDDQADAGAKTYEREQEMQLANNARDMLSQNEHALERLDTGTYGICESCGNPVGKLRLQAAPRATLCMPCKTKEERR